MDAQVNQFFLGFIQDTINLKALIADYNSFFINISFGVNKIEDPTKQKEAITKRFNNLSVQEKGLLLTLLNNVRRIAFSLQTDLKSLEKFLNLNKDLKKTINENYDEIENVFLPDYKKCKEYLQALNDIKVGYINVEAMIVTPEKEQRAIESMQTPKGVGFE